MATLITVSLANTICIITVLHMYYEISALLLQLEIRLMQKATQYFASWSSTVVGEIERKKNTIRDKRRFESEINIANKSSQFPVDYLLDRGEYRAKITCACPSPAVPRIKIRCGPTDSSCANFK